MAGFCKCACVLVYVCNNSENGMISLATFLGLLTGLDLDSSSFFHTSFSKSNTLNSQKSLLKQNEGGGESDIKQKHMVNKGENCKKYENLTTQFTFNLRNPHYTMLATIAKHQRRKLVTTYKNSSLWINLFLWRFFLKGRARLLLWFSSVSQRCLRGGKGR